MAADDGVVAIAPLLARAPDFAAMLAGVQDDAATRTLLASRTTGRPVGAADWIKALEGETDRTLAPAKRGPKPKAEAAAISRVEAVRARSGNRAWTIERRARTRH